MDIYRAVRIAGELQAFVADINPDKEMYVPTRVKLETISSRCVGVESKLSSLLGRSTDLLSITDSSDAVGALQQVSLFVNQLSNSGKLVKSDVLHNLATIGNVCYNLARQISQISEISSDLDYSLAGPGNDTQSLLEQILSKVNDIDRRVAPEKTALVSSDPDIAIDLSDKTCVPSEVAENTESDVDVETTESPPASIPTKPKMQFRIPTRSECMPQFHEMFDKLGKMDFGYTQVNDCAKMLSTWYRLRFDETGDKFRYSVMNIRDWAVGIVIHYGKCLEHGTLDLFQKDFDSWVSRLNDKKSYPVPYNTYHLCKNPTDDDITKTSIVLWDFFSFEIFEKYKKPKGWKRVYPVFDDMMTWILDTHGLQHDLMYDSYRYKPAILDTLGFTKCSTKGVDSAYEIY